MFKFAATLLLAMLLLLTGCGETEIPNTSKIAEKPFDSLGEGVLHASSGMVVSGRRLSSIVVYEENEPVDPAHAGPIETVFFAYDNQGRLMREQHASGTTIDYEYNSNGQVSKRTIDIPQNGIIPTYQTYQYDESGRMIRADRYDLDSDKYWGPTHYRYSGEIVEIEEHNQHSGELFVFFQRLRCLDNPCVQAIAKNVYDHLYRIGPMPAVSPSRTLDRNENGQVTRVGATDHSLWDDWELAYFRNGEFAVVDVADDGAGTHSYEYDSQGRLVSGNGEVTYDAKGRVVQVTRRASGIDGERYFLYVYQWE